MDQLHSDRVFQRQATFKMLRRLHEQNLENRGLNNLSEAFQNFVTRAKFFSIGRLRRNWSHSAVEFMKYRRLLPMLVGDEHDPGSVFDDFDEFSVADPACSSSVAAASGGLFGLQSFSDRRPNNNNNASSSSSSAAVAAEDLRKIFVKNVSARATRSQLLSFFSKFGQVLNCQIPSEKRRLETSMYATLPKHPKKWHGTCTVTFKSAISATKAKLASADELLFYGQQMHLVSNISANGAGGGGFGGVFRRRAGSTTSQQQLSPRDQQQLQQVQQQQQQRSTTAEPSAAGASNTLSRTSSGSSLNSTMSNSSAMTLASNQCLFNLSELPERALVLLLHHVGPIDRIRLERVSKGWLEACASSWLKTDRLMFGEDTDLVRFFCTRRPLRHMHLSCIVRRCSTTLKALSLAGVNHLLEDRALIELGNLCPNLEEIDLSGVVASPEALRVLTESLLCLHSIAYREMVQTNERAFWFLFKAVAQHMRVVDLRGCTRLRGRFFKLFGNRLEEVLLDGCRLIDDQLVEDLCNHCCCLRTLKLDGCGRLSEDSLSLISRHLKELETLTLCGGFPKLSTSVLIDHLPRINSLQRLGLDYNCLVNDALLGAISDALPALKAISLAFAGTDKTISPDGLQQLAKLKQIENLDLSGIAAVNSAVMKAICEQCAQLSRVLLCSCSYLGADGVMEFSRLNNVEHIDLSGCILVSTDSVQALCNALKKEEKDVQQQTMENSGGESNLLCGPQKLVSLVVGGTVCESHRLRVGRCSRVVVDFSDNSSGGAFCATATAGGGRAKIRKMFVTGGGDDAEQQQDDSTTDEQQQQEDEDDEDEFRILSAHRNFISDALLAEEEPLKLDDEQSVREWAEREAAQLGLSLSSSSTNNNNSATAEQQ
ncbi:hypothetical protein niasHT_017685 [Heterodera trifolii]|uniref:Uncharacterized protein n=1 Tax=Heterodera trifolii TaxID=157864 RepID=A0ABD2L889_9BILA